ncbi:uncharacterized protein [Bactrocera oleae]|uniref:uncharacterized protein n=1 Tax=Bactrocera oleae TaxID=104688 RepID=UPI00174DEC30|nr:uncharacterized protein LOC106621859 [Bactrocera oleae]XP_036219458.1 uncharacterized protein LOC106621859 [Bactrocera oleae]XP_036219459.1 uncharacterized protein LOC106621859 [Bactrocera oleae]
MGRKSSTKPLTKEKKKCKATVAKFRKQNVYSQEIGNSSKLSNSSNSIDFSTLDDIRVKYENELEGDSDSGGHYSFECTDYVMEDNNTDLPQNINLELKAWAIRNNITHNTLTDLLGILHKIGVNGLPLSAETLLRTSRDKGEINDISDFTCASPARALVTGYMPHTKKHSTWKSPSRIISDMDDDEYFEFSPKIPISSAEELLTVETKLKSKASYDAMARLLVKTKSFKGSVDGVLRSLFTDDLMVHYNLEGRKAKLALLKLKCIDVIFDVFPERPKEQILLDIRHFIASSHNRKKQQKHKLKIKVL